MDRSRRESGAGPSGIEVEVLYIEGCPGHRALLPELRRLLDGEGIATEIGLREIEDGADAERERFLGSPTVRVDGEDVEPGAAERTDFGFKCRLYRERGALSKAPPTAWIRAALRRRR